MKKFLTLAATASMATLIGCGDDSSSSSATTKGEGVVSCYIYNVIDEESGETDESCVSTPAGTVYADSLKAMCDFYKAIGTSKNDKAEFGKGCPEKKVPYTCLNAEYDSKSDDAKSLTYYYYTLDEDRKALVVKGDNNATCEKLIDYENEEEAAPDTWDDEEDGDSVAEEE